MTMLILALSVFILGVALNGLFAGYETGFYSADRIRIRFFSEEEKNPRATKLLRDLEHPEKMLTMVLIGTNVSLIIGTMALASQIHAAWLTTLIATPIFLIFAEIVPKSVFRRHPNVLSIALYPVMRAFSVLLWPLSWPTLKCVRLLRWMTGVGMENTAQLMSTQEDLRNLIDESAARGTIEREEQEMMHSVMDLQKTLAKEIMVPRIDIQAVPVDTTRAELLELFKESGRTRIPIYRESIDEIIGVANAHDLILDPEPDNVDITRFVQEILYVPDTKPVDDLLQELKQAPQHVAVVTDEYGGTDGLITLEDVLEEIFGEIHDEHDHELALIQKVGPNNFVVDARMPLEDLSEVIGVVIEDDEVETTAGWVMHQAGRIPFQGERLKFRGFRITILEGKHNQIGKIRLDVLPEALEEKGKPPTSS